MREKTIFADGIHDISNEQYHGSAGVSRSQLMLLDESPYHFWYKVLSGLAPRKEATPAMNLGSAFHTLLIEPDLFDKEFCVMPSIDRRTKAGKELYDSFMSDSQGKIYLTQEQYEKVRVMVEGVSKHEIVRTLLEDTDFERSIYWTDQETGLQFKARPDIWSTRMIVDLKTTASANYYQFQRSALEYGYFLQAGMAFEACKAIGKPFEMFVILACEKEEPYVPAVYMMDDDALQFGIDQFGNLKRRLKDCMDTNNWPGYEVRELSVPAYAKKALEETV